MDVRLARRDRMYGENDLSKREIFAGGYLNFGYWRDIRFRQRLTTEQRVVSQEALYRLVLDTLDITEGDRLLEVGCGIGRGTALAAEEYPVREIHGTDLLPVQVERAKYVNASAIAAMGSRLHYVLGSASELPFLDRSAQKVFSVEAAQHFEDLAGFARESFRVLARPGMLAVASFFATRPGHDDVLSQRLETFASGIDLPHHIDVLTGELSRAGYVQVSARSIGKHVWPGLDRWLTHTSYAETWSRQWFSAYTDGLLDYYLITAKRP